MVLPGPGGAHSWQPMSFNPATGLVYIPAQDAGFPYIADPDFKSTKLGYNVGVDFNGASMPQIPEVKKAAFAGIKAYLLAWDPVQQAPAWRIEYPGPSNGGTLTTAGNLVVQGTAGGDLVIYRADDGKRLWSFHGADRRAGGPRQLRGRRRAIHRGAGGLGRRLCAGARRNRPDVRPPGQQEPRAGVQARRARRAAGCLDAGAARVRSAAGKRGRQDCRRGQSTFSPALCDLPRRRRDQRGAPAGPARQPGARGTKLWQSIVSGGQPVSIAAWSRSPRNSIRPPSKPCALT